MIEAIVSFFGSVLIDTWWNVNDEVNFVNEDNQIVLIDTWWNVNRYGMSEKI